MPVYTAELYPTAIRNAGVGACNVAAGVALIIVPYLSLLVCKTQIYGLNQLFIFAKYSIENKKISCFQQNKIQPYFLMLLVASFSIVGSLVVLFLPESMPSNAFKRGSTASQHAGDEEHEER